MSGRRLDMCRIHPDAVRAVAGRTGGRHGIMQTLGISWNSWIKIAAGDPVRRSATERFRDRAARAAPIDGNCLIDAGGTSDDARSVA